MRPSLLALLPLLSFLASCSSTPEHASKPGPLTRAEASGWTETSTHVHVLAFLDDVEELDARDRLLRVSFGLTTENREMVAMAVADPPAHSLEELAARPVLRVLVNANIHGGEVEGKEAAQMLLRELARGEHADWLDSVALLVVPDFNADGNDRIDPHNRSTQNGPDGGVGERPNGQGLDLNRDFLKLESPECRGMLDLVRRFDPHLFLDLHTTNGSYHGYHLTYSPSLATNVDDELDRFARGVMLPALRERMQAQHGWRIFDYGNFVGEGDDRRWATYDHRPRFGTNYFGVRGRFSLLSEAYSYLPFEERVAVTRDLVHETLAFAAEHADEMRAITDAADARVAAGEARFRYDTRLVDPVPGTVLVGAIVEQELPGDLGTRRIARDVHNPEPMGLQVAFRSESAVDLPLAWAIPSPPEGLAKRLALHGIRVEVLASELAATVLPFQLTGVERSRTLYQGHHALSLTGAPGRPADRTLPAGTLFVPARQPLGRLAAQLLDARSEDSLVTWDALPGFVREGQAGSYPVLEVTAVER